MVGMSCRRTGKFHPPDIDLALLELNICGLGWLSRTADYAPTHID